MMKDYDYSIQDLSELTNLPRRTIHFYTQQGILPSPRGAGLGARYDETHLVRLKLIPYFRRQGLRLDDIRDKFDKLDLDSLKEELAKSMTDFPQRVQPKGQSYTHYSLPAGIIMTVPAPLSPSNRDKVSQLLKLALQIFNNSETNMEN